MNDTELDEILNTWSAPPVPASLHKRVRAGFATGPGAKRKWLTALVPRTGIRLVAAAVLAGAALLLIVTQAFPQMLGLGSPPVRTPWTVDSEFIRYAADGSSSIEMYSTSYSLNGNETILSRSMPGNPLKTALGLTLDAAIPIHNRLMLPLVVDPDRMERMMRARASKVGFITGCNLGCLTVEHSYFPKAVPGAATGCIPGPIVGRETILNHPTAAVRQPWTENGRMTLWTAPDLACFALKVTYEDQRPDGTFHLVAAKQALKVTVSP